MTTAWNLRGFTAGCVGGVCRNCVRDGDSIRITAGRHGLPPGRVRCEFSMAVPDSRYPGGVRRFADVYDLDIRLTDEPGVAEVSGVVRLPVAAVVSGIAAFCDLFSAAAGEHGYARMDGGRFDCELNGLRLTYEEAVAVYNAPTITSTGSAALLRYFPHRTNLPPKGYGGSSDLTGYRPIYELDGIFTTYDSPLEVLNLSVPGGMTVADLRAGTYIVNVSGSAAPAKSRLREIRGVLHIPLLKSSPRFLVAPNLEEVRLHGLFYDCDLGGLPKISAASLRCLVENKYAKHPSSPTVTVHPDVFARLTDPEDAGWNAVLEAAAEKGITFASA